jgi:hypothetical protein
MKNYSHPKANDIAVIPARTAYGCEITLILSLILSIVVVLLTHSVLP